MNKTWPFAFNVLYFGGVAFSLPFLVLFYQSVGFTGPQIGVVTGITPLIALISGPWWSNLADATQRHRRVMSLALLIGTVSLAVFPLFTTFVPLLLISIVVNAALAPVTALADSATLFMLADKKEMYGRIRLGGTLGFGAAAALAGFLVQSYGLRLAFWGCAALSLLALGVSQKFHFNPVQAAGAGGGVRVFLADARWRLFLLVALAGGLASASLNNYLFSYLKELGATEATMGLALTLGTLSEIPVLFWGNRLVRRLKPYGLLMAALVITGMRLLLFAAASTPNMILALQLLNGLTFAAMWIAGVAYADENAPAGLGTTAQGLFSAMVFGIGAAAGGFIGGPLLENLGGRGLYGVVGSVVLLTVAVAALLYRRLPAFTPPPAETPARAV